MAFAIGLDIGGTKIAGAVFDQDNRELGQIVLPTPDSYSALVTTCEAIVGQLENKVGRAQSIGAGVPGSVDQKTGTILFTGNTPYLTGKPLRVDLEKILKRTVHIANDADCAALSEAIDGAGAGFNSVFGIIMGTGVGGGFVVGDKLIQGANGLLGEFGQLPLPFREPSDGPVIDCVCGQKGCIDKTISGSGLARLYHSMTTKESDAMHIAEMAKKNDAEAVRVLDQFYTTVAKAMITVIHTYDPGAIVVSGGLSQLPGMFEHVPKRWGQYTIAKNPQTKFFAAKHGAMSGLRGAAWLGR
ncbi:MAG: ROK family protein [Alphaproteobacteria bacterium]